MNLVRWTLGLLLGAFSLHVIILNIGVFYVQLRKIAYPSWIPVLGGVAGSAALLIIPMASLHSFWWIPLLVDPGTVIGHIWTAIYWIRVKRDS